VHGADKAYPAILVDHGDGLVWASQEVVEDRTRKGDSAKEVKQHRLCVGAVQKDQLMATVFQAQPYVAVSAGLNGKKPAPVGEVRCTLAGGFRRVRNGGVGTGAYRCHPAAIAQTHQGTKRDGFGR